MTALAQPGPMLPQRFRVCERRRETDDVVSLALEPVDSAMPAFAPGQFNMLYAFGVGEIPISISGDPRHEHLFIHTVREVGFISRALAALDTGAELGLRGPFGSAWPLETLYGRDVVVLAGGLGIVPLLPVLYGLYREREKFGKVSVIYGSRQPRDLLFQDAIDHFAEKMQWITTVDNADRRWRGAVGVVPKFLPQLDFDPDNTTALMCGPEIMMRFSLQDLLRAGIAAENIFLSLERNMKCAVAHCGHCQFGPEFVCQDGPVFDAARIAHWFGRREV